MSRLSWPRIAPPSNSARAWICAGVAALSACSNPRPLVDTSPAGPSATLHPSMLEIKGPGQIQRSASVWTAVPYTQLPGWQDDQPSAFWQALITSCTRLNAQSPWQAVCRDARPLASAPPDQQRLFLQMRLQPYRIDSTTPSNTSSDVGLLTGYYEPILRANRLAQGVYKTPLWRPPADLKTRNPYWTRQQLDTFPEAQAATQGREIAYVADPIEALVLQIQGSGRALITEPDGRVSYVRLKFAAHNNQPYRSVGSWLIQNGHLSSNQANWPTISDWLKRNPSQVQNLLWQNPRVVFFQEEMLQSVPANAEPNHNVVGPVGAQGVALTTGRSIAVDPSSVPYGTPVWLAATDPISGTALQRLVMAQDTGSAIRGAVRADFFWGAGPQAEQQAGRTKQPLRMWALWPKP